LVFAGALALASAGHAQGYDSKDHGSGSASGQMPKDEYHRNVKEKDPHKGAQREKLESHVEGAKKRDDAQKLDPGKYVPGSPANKPPAK
ncbi:MAG: hypothetical protein L0H37_09480, partial [Nitrosospira sp.]|nr:hypothetical protein [Nitrosospira sp.]